MQFDQLLNYLNEKYPQETQEKWDSSGLLYKGKEQIKKVLVTLDITSDIALYAIENQVDCIISHHPLIFQNYYQSFEYIRMIFIQLYNANISLYSMHTNFDASDIGMNTSYVKQLGYQPLYMDDMIVYFECDGSIYDKLNDLRYPIRIYNKQDQVDKVGLILGAGGSMIEQVNKEKANLFISSEFKHHEIMYAKQHGITLVDVAHQAEVIFVEIVTTLIKERFSELEVIAKIDDYTIEN